jgi:hypothetical protein
MTAALKACQAQARGTWQYLRDFNRLNTATTTARELYDGMQEIYPIASTRAGSERSKHRQKAAMRHTATLTSGCSSRGRPYRRHRRRMLSGLHDQNQHV